MNFILTWSRSKWLQGAIFETVTPPMSRAFGKDKCILDNEIFRGKSFNLPIVLSIEVILF